MNKNEEQKLMREVSSKLKTLLIGNLSRIEMAFGHLWNIGNEPNTQSEMEFSDIWEDLRTDLLNHGNGQIRLTIDEIYDFLYRQNKYKYRYDFIIDDTNNK